MPTFFDSNSARIAGKLSGIARQAVRVRRRKNQETLLEAQALLVSRLSTHKDRLRVTTIRTIVDTLTRVSRLIEDLEIIDQE